MKILIAIFIVQVIIIVGSLTNSNESRSYVRIDDDRLYRPTVGSMGHDLRALYSEEPRAKRSL